MDNIPKVTEEQVKEQFKFINDLVVGGTLTKWLDTELEALHRENPILYNFILERSQKFAMGAMMAHEPHSIAISFALEYVIMLKILGVSFGSLIGMEKFNDMMSKWLKGDNLSGLDDFNAKK